MNILAFWLGAFCGHRLRAKEHPVELPVRPEPAFKSLQWIGDDLYVLEMHDSADESWERYREWREDVDLRLEAFEAGIVID